MPTMQPFHTLLLCLLCKALCRGGEQVVDGGLEPVVGGHGDHGRRREEGDASPRAPEKARRHRAAAACVRGRAKVRHAELGRCEWHKHMLLLLLAAGAAAATALLLRLLLVLLVLVLVVLLLLLCCGGTHL